MNERRQKCRATLIFGQHRGIQRLRSSMVERATHNRQVTGSNPVGANLTFLDHRSTSRISVSLLVTEGDVCLSELGLIVVDQRSPNSTEKAETLRLYTAPDNLLTNDSVKSVTVLTVVL